MNWFLWLVSLPLKGHEIFYLITGLGLVFVVLGLPFPRWFLRMGLTPNQLTIIRVVVFWIGLELYLRGYYWGGHTLMEKGYLWDKTDGQMARLKRPPGKVLTPAEQKEKARGERLDPAADKLTLLVAIFRLALGPTYSLYLLFWKWEGWTAELVIAGLIVITDVIGTIVRWRWVIRRFESFSARIPWLQSRRRSQVAANIVGKSKVVGEYFFKLALAALFQGVMPPRTLTLFLGIATLVLAVWSVVSKLGFGPDVDTHLKALWTRLRNRKPAPQGSVIQ